MARKSDIAFVTFSNNRYAGVETKLVESIKRFYPTADVFVFHSYSEIGCPPHETHPYGFKPYAIDHVKRKGYPIVFWCDSCIRLVKSIEPLIPEIAARGVFLQKDGWVTGQWANDKSLKYFGVSRDEAMDISAVYACIMAFDFRTTIAYRFLGKWKQACDEGIFRGGWKNDTQSESEDIRCLGHRHDQTCAELVSHQLAIPRGFLIHSYDPNSTTRYFTGWNHP
jgi:hypothetical protein